MQKATKEEYLYIAVKWFRNGTEIYNYNDPELDPTKFSKGDQIHAEVNLLGPDALNEPVKTLPVTVLNTPPHIVEASMILRQMPSDVIQARINAVDADNDKIRYRYRWFINGNELVGQSKPHLDVSTTKNGDEIYAEVVALDDEEESAPHKCDPIKMGSNAPQITSKPPSGAGDDRRYVYQVVATAPAPEKLTFSLGNSPTGMTISKTGLIEWQMPDPQLGSHNYDVVVNVTDPTGGVATQEFAINITGEKKRW
jgi:hypothetical protein